jgi:2-dehydropantoate 2-reductase
MQVIVLGAGAIGSLFGAKLAADNDVTLIARPDHVDAINANGLRLEGIQTETVHIRAATRVERLERDALILLTTKVPATSAALEPLVPLVRDDTTVIALQNGLGSERVASEAVCGRCPVLRGITQAGAIFAAPGTIKYMVRGHTVLEQHERSERISAMLNAADLECRISPNIQHDIWHKLIFNCVVNPITTIIGSEVGGIADARLRPLKQAVIDECVAVAAAEGIRFDVDFLHEIDAVYGASRNIVSMLQDIRRGRRTEIDYLNGAVAALGQKHGLRCPANSGLTSIINAFEPL